LGTFMQPLVFRDRELGRANAMRMEKRSVHKVVGFWDSPEGVPRLFLGQAPDPIQSLEVPELAKRDPAARRILGAKNVIVCGFVDEHIDRALGGQLRETGIRRLDGVIVLRGRSVRSCQ